MLKVTLPKGKVNFPARWKFSHDRSGASAVEFALVSPLFLFLLLGMIAWGIYLSAVHGVQQLAADAARTAIAGLNEDERKTLATRFVAANAGSYAFVDAAMLDLDVEDNPDDPHQFVVRVRYDTAGLPIWGLLPPRLLPGRTITRTSTIRIGGI